MKHSLALILCLSCSSGGGQPIEPPEPVKHSLIGEQHGIRLFMFVPKVHELEFPIETSMWILEDEYGPRAFFSETSARMIGEIDDLEPVQLFGELRRREDGALFFHPWEA